MKLTNLIAIILFFASAIFSTSINAAQKPHVEAYEVWEAMQKKPRDIRKFKKLFDELAKDPQKLKELPLYEEPASTFLTKLAALKLTRETADIFEKYLSILKNETSEKTQDQIKRAITELDPMCNIRKHENENSSLWYKTIIALVRQANKFNICEYSESSFLEAALRYGNTNDLQKILRNIAPDWYTGEMVSRLQEYMDRTIKDTKTGTRKKFIDVVLAFEPLRLRNLEAGEYLTERTLRDEIKKRIKNPLDNDDPKIMKEILTIMDAKN